MGALLLYRVRHLGFCLFILLALSRCYGNHVTVNVEGFIECAHCIPVGVTASKASSGTGPRMNIDCKSAGGDLRTLGAGEVDDRGNFKIKFLHDNILKDQVERGSCFLRLDGASGAPCPGQKAQNVSVKIVKSIHNVKRTSTMIRKLIFSSRTCTSTILWPNYDKKNELLRTNLPSPGKSFEYPHQPSVKAFLSPKSGLVGAVPPYARTLNASLQPTASMEKNSKSLSALMSRKLLTFPLPFFRPIFPCPIIQYPSPVLPHPVGNPTPARPTIKKPLPPPTPTSYKSPPSPTAVSPKPLPPPAPVLKKPVLAPPPGSRMPAAPIVPIPKKSPPPPQPPAPVEQPNAPLHPPISPKPKIGAPKNSPRPVLQKPNTPPVPTFNKSAPPSFPSPPSPKALVRPPISPNPVSHPTPKLPHKCPPSPLPIVNSTPPTKQPPSPPVPQGKSISPFPKAPPIPQLPPSPAVPRSYFNSPKSGYRPPSPTF